MENGGWGMVMFHPIPILHPPSPKAMGWLKHLRWKLFVSHLLIIVIGVIVLLATAHFLAGSQLGQEAQLSLGQAAAETGQLAPGTPPPSGIPTEGGVPTQQARFQAVV